MPQFSVNTERLDPYKNFNFRVKWDNQYVAGVSRVTGLRRTTEVVQHHDGADMSSRRKSPGRTEFEAITLERGVTHDVEFERWANRVWDYTNAQATPDQRTKEVSLKDFRKDITIDVYNEAGQKVISYLVYRCWVSEWQALPDLDANVVLIQHLKLENEGWVRDLTVVEPQQQSHTNPT